MPTPIDELRGQIEQLERELEIEYNRTRETWRYKIEAGRIRFDREVRLAHARLRQSLPAFLRESNPASILTAPVIYSLVIPIALIDAWISAYQFVCFPLYGITRVPRSAYIVFDRQHLAYLNAVEKLNCVYCGYANGVLAYVREVAARTEQYWCPIRHAKRLREAHAHYRAFVEYGDAEGYKRRLPMLRAELKNDSQAGGTAPSD